MSRGETDKYIYIETPQLVRKREADCFLHHPVSRRLLEQVNRLGGSYNVERSFKFMHNRLLCNRFIATVPLDRHLKGAEQKVLDIFRSIPMVGEHYVMCKEQLCHASKIHFGFEEDDDHSLLKIYLEFSYHPAYGLSKPWQLLLGFKWDPNDTACCAVSRYVGLPAYTPREMHAKAENFFIDERFGKLRRIVNAILLACDKRAPNLRTWYLDVTEEGNPRRSFDIKTYRFRLKIGDIMPLLPELCRFYRIPFEKYEPYFAAIKNHKFGHLSCGIGRSGDFFMAIYHEAEGQYMDKEQYDYSFHVDVENAPT